MTDDATFERDVRAMLAARDPGPAPAGLASAVRLRLRAGPGRSPLRGALAWSAGLAAVAVVVVTLVLLPRPIGPAPGGAGGGTSETIALFDPTITGAGLVRRPSELFPVPFVVAAALVAGGYAAIRIRRRWPRLAAVGLAAAVGLSAYGLGTAPFVEWHGGAWQYGQGWVEATNPPDGTSDEPPERAIATFAVGPGGILTYGFDVHNSAKVPITILGLAEDPPRLAWGTLNAVGLLRDPDVFDIAKPDDTRAFSPIQVEPDERAFLVVAGRADACALPPGSVDPDGAGASFQRVDVVYEILGLRRVTTVELPFVGRLAMDSACMSRG